MSEWAPHTATGTLQAAKRAPHADPSGGDKNGHNAAHILVYDRKSKRLAEETISPHLILAMRQIYQSRVHFCYSHCSPWHGLESTPWHGLESIGLDLGYYSSLTLGSQQNRASYELRRWPRACLDPTLR